MARIRLEQTITSGEASVRVELWVDAPGPLEGSDVPALAVLIPVLLYPLDKCMSLVVAVRAPFDGNLDLQWGAFGALAGMTLPWVTNLPYVYPPLLALQDLPLQLDRAAYAEFVARVQRGDGVAAYVAAAQRGPVTEDPGELRAVRILSSAPGSR